MGTYLELTDTPGSYGGKGAQFVAVKATEDGLEFVDSGVQGPQGPQGYIGEQGVIGEGVQGSQGPEGSQGEQGQQGWMGVQGPSGIGAGDQGYQGYQGLTGDQGDTGAQGPTGSQGYQGYQGNQGYQGETGDTGDQGSQGYQGDQGPQGGGVTTFLGLTDTPASYSGKGGKLVAVKSAEDGLEFPDIRVEPLQPAFLVYNSVTDENETGDGTLATVEFDTEVFDQGDNFATPIFTAPVDGRYPLFSTVRLGGVGGDRANIEIVTSNRIYIANIIHAENCDAAGNWLSISISAIVDMDANDTAYIRVSVSGTTKVVDIYGSSSPQTYFSGALLC